MRSPYRKIKRKVKVKPAVILPELPAEEQVQQMVGSDWFRMSEQDQKSLTKEMIADGVVTKMENGGAVSSTKDLWNNLEPQIRYDVLLENFTMGKDEPLYDFTLRKIRKMAFLPYKLLGADYQSKVDNALQMGWGGKVMAEGGSVAATKIKVIYTLGDGKMVTQNYNSKEESDEGIANYMIENDVVDVKVEEEKKKSSLADIAKVEKKGAKSKSDQPKVELDGYESDIAEYKRINERVNIMKAEKEIVSGRIKEAALQKWLEMYEDKRTNPDTIKLVDGDESILYVPQDKYLSVTDEKKAMLENYGKNLVETVTTYEFTDLIEKELPNGQTIGEVVIGMIMDNKLIPERDKMNLIKAKVVSRVPKGTIDRLLDFENPEEVFKLVQPTVMLR